MSDVVQMMVRMQEDVEDRRRRVDVSERSLPGDQPPRGAGGNAGVSTPERLMGHQPVTEDPGSRRETRRPVETTAGTVGSGTGRLVTHLKQNIGQCPAGKRTSVRCCVPGAGSRRGGASSWREPIAHTWCQRDCWGRESGLRPGICTWGKLYLASTSLVSGVAGQKWLRVVMGLLLSILKGGGVRRLWYC